MTDKKVIDLVSHAQKPKRSGGGGSGSGGGNSKILARFGEYCIKNGMFHHVKSVKSGGDAGVIEYALCDFVCRINDEVIHEDGLTESSYYRISGKRFDGADLAAVEIPAKSFNASQSTWPNDAWGTRVVVYAGNAKASNLKVAVLLYSRIDGDVPRVTVYGFTGWRQIEGAWHYLTGSGAVAEAGLIESVQVELGQGHIKRYSLPAPPVDCSVLAAEALKLLSICPDKPHIGAVLLAAVGRAPLNELHPADFALWLYGVTGSRKSAITAIALAFFGNFTARTFPANWTDSINDLESKAFQAKDSIFVVDDFKPSVSQAEAAKLYATAERLIRNTGNQAGRGRRSVDMQAKAAPYNRALMIVTGEDLPRGQSLIGRLLVLEIGRTDVDNTTLSMLQEAARHGLFASLMARYTQWLAGRMNDLKSSFSLEVENFRNAAIRDGFAASHPRAPEIYANLFMGTVIFIEFLIEVGAIPQSQADEVVNGIEQSLKQVFTQQGDYQQDEDEVLRFFELLQAALASGNAHIANRIDQGPPATKPFSYGWRSSGVDDSGDKRFQAMGDAIGWLYVGIDGQPDEVWLQPDSAFKTVQQYARQQGDSFLISRPTLYRRLLERGYLLASEPRGKTGKPRPDVKRVVNNSQGIRVLVVDAQHLIESTKPAPASIAP